MKELIANNIMLVIEFLRNFQILISTIVFIASIIGFYWKLKLDININGLAIKKIDTELDEIKKDRKYKWDCYYQEQAEKWERYNREQKEQFGLLGAINEKLGKIATDMEWVKGIVKQRQ